jgi:DNA-binding transcriptional regulator YdaS (Cro superfamily)
MTRSSETMAAIERNHPGMTALRLAVELCGGSPTMFALAIGATPAKVSAWLNTMYKVPFEWVPDVVAACNDPRITPQTLRPDFSTGWELLRKQLSLETEPQ